MQIFIIFYIFCVFTLHSNDARFESGNNGKILPLFFQKIKWKKLMGISYKNYDCGFMPKKKTEKLSIITYKATIHLKLTNKSSEKTTQRFTFKNI